MTNRTPARFTLIVTTDGTVEIELPETFAEGDSDALVAAVRAVTESLRDPVEGFARRPQAVRTALS